MIMSGLEPGCIGTAVKDNPDPVGHVSFAGIPAPRQLSV